MVFLLKGECQVIPTVNLVCPMAYLMQFVHLDIVIELKIYMEFLEINITLFIFKPEQQKLLFSIDQ